MNLERILAISGKPGLFALKMQTRTGFVAESLLDGKKITVSLRSNVSLLSEISLYTYSEEKPLVEVLKAIAAKENNAPAPNFKDDKAQLTAYFESVVPDFDKERVYASDIKKVLNWYNILQANGLVVTEEVKEDKEVKEEKPKKAKAEKDEKTEAAEEKPKKAKATKTKE